MPRPGSTEDTRAMKAVQLYHDLLFGGPVFYLSEIAERYGWPKSTALRVVQSIDSALHVVESGIDSKGRRWFRIKASRMRPRATLGTDIVRHLAACCDASSPYLPQSLKEELKTAISSLTCLLEDMTERDLAQATTLTAAPRCQVDYSGFREIIDRLSLAIAEKTVVKLTYRSPGRIEPKIHLVAPMRLIAHLESLYVKCVHVNEDYSRRVDMDPMLCAVQRIEDVELTPDGFSFLDSDEGADYGLMKNDEATRVRVAFSGYAVPYVRERIWSPDQVIEETDSGLVLEFSTRSVPETLSLVLSFGMNAKVLGPESLIELVRENVEGLHEFYVPTIGT